MFEIWQYAIDTESNKQVFFSLEFVFIYLFQMEAKPGKKMHLQFFYSVVIANLKLEETGLLYYFEYNFFIGIITTLYYRLRAVSYIVVCNRAEWEQELDGF